MKAPLEFLPSVVRLRIYCILSRYFANP